MEITKNNPNHLGYCIPFLQNIKSPSRKLRKSLQMLSLKKELNLLRFKAYKYHLRDNLQSHNSQIWVDSESKKKSLINNSHLKTFLISFAQKILSMLTKSPLKTKKSTNNHICSISELTAIKSGIWN